MADSPELKRELEIDDQYNEVLVEEVVLEDEDIDSKLCLTNNSLEEEEEEEQQPKEEDGQELIEEKNEKQQELEKIVDEIKTDEESEKDEKEKESNDKQSLSSKERERSKERDRSRKDTPDHCNTSDIKSIRSRVFVGHLNTVRATRDEMRRLFSKCGKVLNVSILNGYGFVQFDSEKSALEAIATIHGHYFLGIRLVVDKPEAWKKLDGDDLGFQTPWPNSDTSERSSSRHRDRRRDDDDDRRERRRERRRSPIHHERRRRYDDYYDEAPRPSRYRDPYYERYLEMRYAEERFAERYHAEMEHYYNRYRYAPPLQGRTNHTHLYEDEHYMASTSITSRYPTSVEGRGLVAGSGVYGRYERPREDLYADQQRGGAYNDYYN